MNEIIVILFALKFDFFELNDHENVLLNLSSIF